MKHSELITAAIMIAGFILYKIIGKGVFTVLFATTFIVLFLAPIVIVTLSLKTSKKLKIMMDDYYESKDLEHIAHITTYLTKKRYQGPEDFKFFKKMRDLFASVEAHPHATDETIQGLKFALSKYNIEILPEMDQA